MRGKNTQKVTPHNKRRKHGKMRAPRVEFPTVTTNEEKYRYWTKFHFLFPVSVARASP